MSAIGQQPSLALKIKLQSDYITERERMKIEIAEEGKVPVSSIYYHIQKAKEIWNEHEDQ